MKPALPAFWARNIDEFHAVISPIQQKLDVFAHKSALLQWRVPAFSLRVSKGRARSAIRHATLPPAHFPSGEIPMPGIHSELSCSELAFHSGFSHLLFLFLSGSPWGERINLAPSRICLYHSCCCTVVKSTQLICSRSRAKQQHNNLNGIHTYIFVQGEGELLPQ